MIARVVIAALFTLPVAVAAVSAAAVSAAAVSAAAASAEAASAEAVPVPVPAAPALHLPSSISASAASSSSETTSATLGLNLMLPYDFWVAVSVDSAREKTDELETKTTGGSLSVGTDPLAEYGVEAGIDGFGVDNQYRVQEARLRVSAFPNSVFSVENPGFEIGLEVRAARFSFVNTPNIIFSTSEVTLETKTVHLDAAWSGWNAWILRIYGEQTSIPSAFNDLNRPLASLFIPESAISTAVSWPSDEGGVSIEFTKRRWIFQLRASQKHAAVSGAVTALNSLGADYKWTHSLRTGLRVSSSRSLDDESLSPIQTVGIDISLAF